MFVRTFTDPQNTHNTHAAIQFQLAAGLMGSEAMAAGTTDIAVGIQILITPTNTVTQAPIVVTISVIGGSARRKLVDIANCASEIHFQKLVSQAIKLMHGSAC